MEEYVDVAGVGELPVGRAKAVKANGRAVALYHTREGYFASDNACPHRGGPLGEGDIIGNEIVCPWHLWGFDLTTGECTGDRSIRINTHEVKVEGDRILVRLSPARETSESL